MLLVSAMLLINAVMLRFEERDRIQTKLHTGRLLLDALEQKVGYEVVKRNASWTDLESNFTFRREIKQLLRSGGFSDVSLIDAGGTRVYGLGPSGHGEKEAISISREALVTGKWSSAFYGSMWGVFWPARERVRMSSPMLYEGRLVGAISICAHLGPLYQDLRESQTSILVYIFLNTIILCLLGVYLVSRAVVKPIRKLMRITKEFKEGESFQLPADSPRNEIGQLYRSLNLMLKRLEENKKDLESHISSLEKANKEIKRAQNEVIRSEKLASVGRLATGVAHEIGNPIGIILGYLELFKSEGLEEEERQDFLDRIESEITRINQIIRQLLDFSRPSSGEGEQISVHYLLMDTVNMLEPQPMMAHLQIRPVLKASKDSVWAEPNQLRQVFINIIMNSADAMAGDEISFDKTTANTLSIETIDMEDSIKLSFTDSGPGIPQEQLVDIFDPFHTTKDPGRGTGLGLSVCHRIIEDLGGAIRAESAPGKGATIIIDIPLHRIKADRQDELPQKA